MRIIGCKIVASAAVHPGRLGGRRSIGGKAAHNARTTRLAYGSIGPAAAQPTTITPKLSKAALKRLQAKGNGDGAPTTVTRTVTRTAHKTKRRPQPDQPPARSVAV